MGLELGAPCLALIGTSLGGMAAVPISGLEPRVAAAVILLGGANLEWIARPATREESQTWGGASRLPRIGFASIPSRPWSSRSPGDLESRPAR